MNITEAFEVYGEISARAMEQIEANREWQAWIEGGAQ